MDSLKTYGLPALGVVLLIVGAVAPTTTLQVSAWTSAPLAFCAAAIVYNTRLGTALTALWCAVANGYLLWGKVKASSAPAICDANEIFNCTKVNNLPESELFGLPVTLLGAAFYFGLLAAAAAGPKAMPRLHQVTGLFMLLALGFSAYLFNVTIQNNLVCVFCYSIYVGNILLFWAAMKGMGETESKLFDDLGGIVTAPSFLAIAGIYVVGVGIGAASVPNKGAETPKAPISKQKDPSAVVAKLYMTVGGPLELDGLEPLYGNADAKYQIVEFADFGCGHCAHAFPKIHDLVKNNPDVNVRFKNYPLAGQCNPLLPEGREGVCVAAIAAECATQQGKFWPYAEQLFFNQTGLSFSPEEMEFLADHVGLDVEQWRQCAQDPNTQQPILADALAGGKAEVHGTPAFFLKGTHGDQWVMITHTPDDVARVIEAHRDGVSLPPPRPYQGR